MTDPLLAVCELFYSLQGESTRAGLPCAFVRLAGCNLRCRYCDSSYTWEEEGRALSVAEIMAWLGTMPGVMAEITGGEPLRQEGIYPLLAALLAEKRRVLLETNGSLPLDRIPGPVSVILDLKCPDSGMVEHMDWNNLELLVARRKTGSRDEVKFVLSSETDYRWAREIIFRHRLSEFTEVLLSPVAGRLSPARLAELMLEDRIPARLQLQLHRIIWPERERGV